ncbi:MAG: DsrE family protein [Chitinophagales bacterium]|nr:DsrE family protein [Chitinophagaceae bacterium]MBP9884366.1 DsrE family protein [Chitinophagales bacterium]
MKKLVFVTMVLIMANVMLIRQVSAQVATKDAGTAAVQHKIVFQLTSDDTLSHKALMKQLNNIVTVAPDAKVEVVCHGPGLNVLIKGKTIVQGKIGELNKKGITFVACEFSMKERNVPKENIIPEAGFVKYGILEIVTKQEEGWSYIKSGF